MYRHAVVLVGNEPVNPSPSNAINGGILSTLIIALIAPTVLFLLGWGKDAYLERQKQANKREDTEEERETLALQQVLTEKEKLLENAVTQQQTVFNDLVTRNHAQIEKLFELQSGIMTTQTTIAEAVKFNSQNILANTLEIATSLKTNNETTTGYLLSALNTQSSLYADTNRQMQKVLDTVEALHRRFDEQYGSSHPSCGIK